MQVVIPGLVSQQVVSGVVVELVRVVVEGIEPVRAPVTKTLPAAELVPGVSIDFAEVTQPGRYRLAAQAFDQASRPVGEPAVSTVDYGGTLVTVNVPGAIALG